MPSDVRAVQNVPTVPILASTHVTQTNVPWLGNVRVGRQKEPFSLDHLESHRLLPFMERSFLSDLTTVSAFNSGYSPGVSAFRTWADGRVYTHGGVYKNLDQPVRVRPGRRRVRGHRPARTVPDLGRSR